MGQVLKQDLAAGRLLELDDVSLSFSSQPTPRSERSGISWEFVGPRLERPG